MKKKIFIFCVFFLLIFLCFWSYKFLINGNNKNIENVNELDKFISNIRNYDIEAKVTVYSNKNSNTYNLKQYKMGNYQKQEILSDGAENGIIIENDENMLKIKNTKLDVEEIYENYEEVARNAVGFDSFLDDYMQAKENKITEDDNYYIVFVKVKDSNNKYIESKTLYINKHSSQIEKIEIKDVNNKDTIIIEYTKFQIL